MQTPAFNARGGARAALPAGLRDGAGDAAVAQLDDDRALSGGARHPRERALPAGELSGRRRAAAEGRLPHDGVRLVVRAGAPLRARARVRRLRRRARRRASERTARETTDLALAELDAPTEPAAIHVGALLRSRTRRTTPPEPFRSRYAATPYLGEVAAMDEQIGRLVQAFEQQAAGRRGDRDRGRSRRGARRSRRVAARQSALPVDDARAAGRLLGPGVTPGVSDDAGQHAAGVPHHPRLGGARRGRQPARIASRRSCSARR